MKCGWKNVSMVICCIIFCGGIVGCADRIEQKTGRQLENQAIEGRESEEMEISSEEIQTMDEQELMKIKEAEETKQAELVKDIEETEKAESVEDTEEAAETPEEKTARLRGTEPKTPAVGKDEVTDLRIEIHKQQHALQLWNGTDLIAEYAVGLAKNPVGAKQKEGDNKNPEGTYYVCSKNSRSQYHLALGLSYPNAEDAKRGYEEGLISELERDNLIRANENGKKPDWYTALGGEIMIHGQKGESGGESDWTRGCFAVDNEVMDMIWDYVDVGTVVEITAD